jgi:restriction system protein
MGLFKGWRGEIKTRFYLWLSLSQKKYVRYHNLILPSRNGTTEIDHLILSVYGVHIVETKNKKGWIFGSEFQPNWTQVIYDNSYSFQNPLRQAHRQKMVLSEFLNIDPQYIFPIIYFCGDSVLKTPMPGNVITRRPGRYIKQAKTQVFSTQEVHRMIESIEQFLSESRITKREHIRSLNTRHSSDSICPRCGSNLVERTVKSGNNKDTRFLGCSNFPKCRFSRDL